MRYIDVHCHLDGDCYGNLGALFDRLQTVGVEKVVAAGFDLKSSEFSANLAKKRGMCYFTAGFHPTELKNFKDVDLEKIAVLARHEKCVAIGEIGLDYHYPDTDKILQKEVFAEQLKLADRLGLPVQIHSRDAAEDTLEILAENKRYINNSGLMHCYSYSVEVAQELKKLGFKFSFGGTSTYSGSKRARRVVAALDLEDILSETDSPYLPPQSKRGLFPNTPESIPEIVANIAMLRGISPECAAEAVWNNAHDLFKKLNG